mgnify:FL=1|tara:strand:+ start:1209 stop:1709 length:501 start_codon:yes stop_codon:yes gene_type:complete
MANLNKPTFAVSVTPKVIVGETDNQAGEHSVIHEAVGRTLGGNGEYTGDDIIVSNNGGASTAGWDEGVATNVTSNGSTIAVDASVGIVFIKHTGFLVGTTTASVAADTVKILNDISASSTLSGTDTVISELKNGEAIILIRPGAGSDLVLASGSSHVDVEVCVIDT